MANDISFAPLNSLTIFGDCLKRREKNFLQENYFVIIGKNITMNLSILLKITKTY